MKTVCISKRQRTESQSCARAMLTKGNGRVSLQQKVENHAAAVALYFMYCKFGRVHQTLRVALALEADFANHI